jgi:hypothetical protein
MKTFEETLEWAKGYILIAIGRGDYEGAVWSVVVSAWERGYKEGQKEAKKVKK